MGMENDALTVRGFKRHGKGFHKRHSEGRPKRHLASRLRLLCLMGCLMACAAGCGGKENMETGVPELGRAIQGEELSAEGAASEDSGIDDPLGEKALLVCEELELAMTIPKSVARGQVGKEDPHVVFHGENESLDILLGQWNQVSDPETLALAELVSKVTEMDAEVVDCDGLAAVRVNWTHGDVNYYFLAPNGDAYYLCITPYVMKDPAVYDKVRAIEKSICRAGNNSNAGGEVGTVGALNITAGSTESALEIMYVSAPKREEVDYLVLVNSKHPLPEDWEEKLDLVCTVNSVGDRVWVERTAYKAYLELRADLLANEGIDVDLDSAYRSVQYQQEILEKFTEKYGAAYAARTVAKPGYSEHHTGLALDLYFRLDGVEVYENEDLVLYPEVWKRIHARLADHGFILRYPGNKDGTVDYTYEPWHIRYVGKEVAKELMQEKIITLEDYLGEQ